MPITKRGQPISGGSGQWKPTPNSRLQNHAAETSEDAQNLVSASATPFRSSYGPAMLPAPTQPDNSAASDFSQDGLRFGGRGRSSSVRQKPTVQYGAVGYSNGPYQTRKGLQSINSGFPNNPASQVGPGSFPKNTQAKARASMAKIGLGSAYDDFKRYGG